MSDVGDERAVGIMRVAAAVVVALLVGCSTADDSGARFVGPECVLARGDAHRLQLEADEALSAMQSYPGGSLEASLRADELVVRVDRWVQLVLGNPDCFNEAFTQEAEDAARLLPS